MPKTWGGGSAFARHRSTVDRVEVGCETAELGGAQYVHAPLTDIVTECKRP